MRVENDILSNLYSAFEHNYEKMSRCFKILGYDIYFYLVHAAL